MKLLVGLGIARRQIHPSVLEFLRASGCDRRNRYEEGLKPIRPQSQPGATAVSHNIEL